MYVNIKETAKYNTPCWYLFITSRVGFSSSNLITNSTTNRKQKTKLKINTNNLISSILFFYLI